MFVLERILRGLSEENSLTVQSLYCDLLEEIRLLRRLKAAEVDYHERLRMVFESRLKRAIEGLSYEVPNNLKIILLANDLRIRSPVIINDVDWIRLVKELIEGKELSLLVRLLRYLRVSGLASLNEQIPLLLLNSINKLLASNDQRIIGQVLQIIKLIDFGRVDDGILRTSLKKLLRGNMNDRIKWMILKILKQDEHVDEADVIRMLDVKNSSALIHSVLKDEYGLKCNPAPKSSSKVVNLLNGQFEGFSEIEKAVLTSQTVESDNLSLNEYEKYIAHYTSDVRDPNILRELLRTDRITVEEYMRMTKSESHDSDLIVLKTNDPEVFWMNLGQCEEFISDKMHGIELRKEFYDYYKPLIDLKESRLPVLWYFFRLIKEFESDLMQYKEIGAELYKKYAGNFDGSASAFLLQ